MGANLRFTEDAWREHQAKRARWCAANDFPDTPRGASACSPCVVSHGESACVVKADSDARCGAPDHVAAPHKRGRASSINASSAKAPADGESPSSAGRDQRAKADAPPVGPTGHPTGAASSAPDQQQAGRTVSRVAHNHEIPGATPGPASNDVLTLPWPPTGNTAVRHAQGGHYLTQDVRDYRAAVGVICRDYAPVKGRYRLHVHLSPPDKRRRDADNACKQLLDALVLAGYVQDDAMAYMRELVVTVDDEPCYGWAKVRAVPMEEFAA